MGDTIRVQVEGDADRTVVEHLLGSGVSVLPKKGAQRTGKDAMVERVRLDLPVRLRQVVVRDLDELDVPGVFAWVRRALGVDVNAEAVPLGDRACGVVVGGTHVAIVAAGLRGDPALTRFSLPNAMLDDYVARAIVDRVVQRWLRDGHDHDSLVAVIEECIEVLRRRGFSVNSSKRVHALARVAVDRDLRPAGLITQLMEHMPPDAWEPLRSDLSAAVAWVRSATPL